MGARAIIAKSQPSAPGPVPRVFHRDKYKRAGTVTEAEQALVTKFVQDQPKSITPTQERALAKVLRRSREVVKSMIDAAREDLAASVQDYVKYHKEAVQQALENGDAKSLDVAARASQWAMENISIDGSRIVDKVKQEPTGTQIMIGVKVGGVNEGQTGVTVVQVPPVPPSLEPPAATLIGGEGGGGVLIDPSPSPQGSTE